MSFPLLRLRAFLSKGWKQAALLPLGSTSRGLRPLPSPSPVRSYRADGSKGWEQAVPLPLGSTSRRLNHLSSPSPSAVRRYRADGSADGSNSSFSDAGLCEQCPLLLGSTSRRLNHLSSSPSAVRSYRADGSNSSFSNDGWLLLVGAITVGNAAWNISRRRREMETLREIERMVALMNIEREKTLKMLQRSFGKTLKESTALKREK